MMPSRRLSPPTRLRSSRLRMPSVGTLLQLAAALCALAACCCLMITAAAASPLVRFPTQSTSRADWRAVRTADPDESITLLFALRHSPEQLQQLSQAAHAVSAPDSDTFRQYLSLDQINARFTPPSDAQDIVLAFVREQLSMASAHDSNESAQAVSSAAAASSASAPRVEVLPGGFVRVDQVKVSDAARMLQTEFSVFEKLAAAAADATHDPLGSSGNPDADAAEAQPTSASVDHTSDAPIIRASTDYALPASVAEKVDFVGGVTHLPTTRFQARIHRMRTQSTQTEATETQAAASTEQAEGAAAAIAMDPTYSVTPRLLRQQYNIPVSARGSNSDQNRQAIPSFLEQYYAESDLQLYLRQHGIEPRGSVSRVIGPNHESQPGGEASLDTQLIMAMAPGIKTEFWSFAGRRDNDAPPSNFNQEPFLDWLLHLASDPSPPLVHSVSYADDEKDCTPEYMDRLNVEFQKAALRGISILFASGDDGIGSVDSRNNAAATCTQHHPNFPSSSPWITSVGGTQLSPLQATDLPFRADRRREEVTCSARTGCAVTTGGGFSHRFPRPAYQQEAVDTYLRQASADDALDPHKGGAGRPWRAHPLLPPTSWFNSSNRGYPDVSILATNYPILVGGRQQRTGGTSASAPVMAAMVSLWNEHLMQQGKPPLGFINPWLYALAKEHASAVFQDVTSGQGEAQAQRSQLVNGVASCDNACSQDPGSCCPYGFSATAGWDAVTGVGTPNFDAIRQLL